MNSLKLHSNDNQKLIVNGSVILENTDPSQVKINQANKKDSKISRSVSVDSSDQLNTELALVFYNF